MKMTKIIRYIKIEDQIIDLMYVDEIIDETYKGYDFIIRNAFEVSHRFSLNEAEGEKLHNFIYKHWQEFQNKNNYKLIEYKND